MVDWEKQRSCLLQPELSAGGRGGVKVLVGSLNKPALESCELSTTSRWQCSVIRAESRVVGMAEKQGMVEKQQLIITSRGCKTQS